MLIPSVMSPFNLNSYENLLCEAKVAGYRFINFSDIKDSPARGGRCLLRHDVDGDLYAACSMAELEASVGVFSTYFLMLKSPCYNLMSRAGMRHAETILHLGHQIGLHYDQGWDSMRGTSANISQSAIQKESAWIENLLGCRVEAVSFHQPSADILQNGIDCGERINTYDRNLLRDFCYVSDSNRVFPLWQESMAFSEASTNAMALARRYPADLQLLIHPMWWVYNHTTTEDVWDQVLRSNFDSAQEQMLATERAFGPI